MTKKNRTTFVTVVIYSHFKKKINFDLSVDGYTKVFKAAESEFEVRFKKFKMAESKWRLQNFKN